MKILSIVGARPQFIKVAMLDKAICNYDDVCGVIVHTGQHFDDNMSDIFFRQLGISAPNYNLNINSLGYEEMIEKMSKEIENILIFEKPNWVVVFGDTNSTLAGALAANKLNIKIAHVEAGLRSFNPEMREETNRVSTDKISSLLFCPNKGAYDNLMKEGFDDPKYKIFNVGDIMRDAALFYAENSQKPNLNLPERFILATVHRAENTDSKLRLKNILSIFDDIANKIPVIFPVHPRTAMKIKEYGLEGLVKGVNMIEPVGYFEMLFLLKNCSLTITDSGGLQKEAFFFKKSCLVLRKETEWNELVEYGYSKLIDDNSDNILNVISEMINRKISYEVDLYGDGKTSKKILDELLKN